MMLLQHPNRYLRLRNDISQDDIKKSLEQCRSAVNLMLACVNKLGWSLILQTLLGQELLRLETCFRIRRFSDPSMKAFHERLARLIVSVDRQHITTWPILIARTEYLMTKLASYLGVSGDHDNDQFHRLCVALMQYHIAQTLYLQSLPNSIELQTLNSVEDTPLGLYHWMEVTQSGFKQTDFMGYIRHGAMCNTIGLPKLLGEYLLPQNSTLSADAWSAIQTTWPAAKDYLDTFDTRIIRASISVILAVIQIVVRLRDQHELKLVMILQSPTVLLLKAPRDSDTDQSTTQHCIDNGLTALRSIITIDPLKVAKLEPQTTVSDRELKSYAVVDHQFEVQGSMIEANLNMIVAFIENLNESIESRFIVRLNKIDDVASWQKIVHLCVEKRCRFYLCLSSYKFLYSNDTVLTAFLSHSNTGIYSSSPCESGAVLRYRSVTDQLLLAVPWFQNLRASSSTLRGNTEANLRYLVQAGFKICAHYVDCYQLCAAVIRSGIPWLSLSSALAEQFSGQDEVDCH